MFLTVRQELKRFQRKGLGYSKDLATHNAAVAMFLGVYNFVRKHKTLGTMPAVFKVKRDRSSVRREVFGNGNGLAREASSQTSLG